MEAKESNIAENTRRSVEDRTEKNEQSKMEITTNQKDKTSNEHNGRKRKSSIIWCPRRRKPNKQIKKIYIYILV